MDVAHDWVQRHTPYKKHVVRFAPSPTGYLHLGNIYSALYTQHIGKLLNADILLRIEDIDEERCRPEYTEQIYKDMEWIGYEAKGEVVKQSTRMNIYAQKIGELDDLGLLYPCFCSRKTIRQTLKRNEQKGIETIYGPDGALYPGTCKHLNEETRQSKVKQGKAFALRLDVQKSLDYLHQNKGIELKDLYWFDRITGQHNCDPTSFGDIVIARKDYGTSYHASVVIDDAWQEISVVTRGVDLLPSTHIHRLLQALWDFPTPFYDHHRLLKEGEHNEDGNALSKCFKSEPLKNYAKTHKKNEVIQIIEKHPVYEKMTK